MIGTAVPPEPAAIPGKRTAKAVAELAGVSVTTVSRVLNGRADAISPETRERVLTAARQLKYRPNALAVALRKGVTHTIGLIVPDIGDAYFHQVARGLEDAAQVAGYTVIFCNTDRIAARERSSIQVLLDQHVDGIVFAGGGIDDDMHLKDLYWDAMHVVAVGPHNLACPSIRVDDAGTIALAVTHLLEQGCSQILCLAGQDNWAINTARLDGYARAIAAHGLQVDPRLIRNGSFRVESGRAMVAEAIADGVDFDGIVAFNDYAAIGAMQALTERGRRVPEDIAVVGCDDVPVSSLVQPSLSSVSFPQYEFGRQAMELIEQLIAGQPVPEVTTFPYHLEVRGSSRRS